MKKNLKKVLVFGSFDLVHKGHVNFLKQAKKLGDELIVVVARDDTIEKVKKRKPKFDEKTRLKHVREIVIADKVVLGLKKDKYKIIEKIKPDIIALGYDQESFLVERLNHELEKRELDIKIIRLKPYKPHIYKSSRLKKI
jgi:FAD synthetase